MLLVGRPSIAEERGIPLGTFGYPSCGEKRTMPGLAFVCAAERIGIDDGGNTVGLA